MAWGQIHHNVDDSKLTITRKASTAREAWVQCCKWVLGSSCSKAKLGLFELLLGGLESTEFVRFIYPPVDICILPCPR